MPQGLQAWDSAGNLIIDISTRTGFVLGRVDVSTGNQSGNVTASELADGSPFYFIVADPNESSRYPYVSFSGTQMTWTQSATSAFSGAIFYGVY